MISTQSFHVDQWWPQTLERQKFFLNFSVSLVLDNATVELVVYKTTIKCSTLTGYEMVTNN